MPGLSVRETHSSDQRGNAIDTARGTRRHTREKSLLFNLKIHGMIGRNS